MHEGDYFRQQERVALDKLKAAMAKKKKPIDEDDEKVRLSNILEKVGVREVIREELSVQLLLWKHDEDLVLAEQSKNLAHSKSIIRNGSALRQQSLPDSAWSSASSAATSASLSANPPTAKFSASRAFDVVFGTTAQPFWSAQRSSTCAADVPCAAAAPTTAGCASSGPPSAASVALPASWPPELAYAWTTMPSLAQYARSAACEWYGWSSTWLTAGGHTRAVFLSVSRCATVKFETPIELALGERVLHRAPRLGAERGHRALVHPLRRVVPAAVRLDEVLATVHGRPRRPRPVHQPQVDVRHAEAREREREALLRRLSARYLRQCLVVRKTSSRESFDAASARPTCFSVFSPA